MTHDSGSNDIHFNNHSNKEVTVSELLGGKITPENYERFMAYENGCDNKSELVRTEKELKELLSKYARNSSWTGKIIGYKLVPLYEAEKMLATQLGREPLT